MSKRETFGQSCIDSLKEFLSAVKAGKPIEQSIVRRMKVKGKTVYTRETFKAPIK